MAKKEPEYLKEYATVAERIQHFWEDYPDGGIETNPVEVPDDNTVRVYARVGRYVNNQFRILGTGQAEEKREGYINTASAVENCETSAVGRALAMAGFDVKKGIASVEEIALSNRRRRVDEGEPAEYLEPLPQQPPPAESSTQAVETNGAQSSQHEEEIDELVRQCIAYVNQEGEDEKIRDVRKEFVRAKLMSLGVDHPSGLRSSVLELTLENRAALAEWLTT